MEELKMLYIAPEAELKLFMPVEGIAYDDSWLMAASAGEDDGTSGPGVDVELGGGSGDDGQEAP